MARKRLTPARALYLDGQTDIPAGAARPPIAQVAGETATLAALDAVSAELHAAEAEGRLVLSLPLDAVDPGYLIRDRLAAVPEAQSALVESLRARGQQTPIEVTAAAPGPDGAPRYGLISGWRRLLALQALHAETGEARFAHVLAFLRRPEAAGDAYVAMVEENEIRSGLSFYERARVVARAAEGAAFLTRTEALRTLFASAPAPKRSKIKSFLAVVDAFDGHLHFPSHIPERTGLAMAAALAEDAGFADRLRQALETSPPATPAAEARIIARALSAPVPKTLAARHAPGVALRVSRGRVVLEGAGVDAAFAERLKAWLDTQTR